MNWNDTRSAYLTLSNLIIPPPTLHTGQNILLNACSLKIFASLTTRNGGSYIPVFTVLLAELESYVGFSITSGET